MAKRIIYTAGYGNSTKEQFRTLLVDAGIFTAIDVRRPQSKGRLRSYDLGDSMANTLHGITYWDGSILGNVEASLDKYKHWLNSRRGIDAVAITNCYISLTGHPVCFICCEKYAYVDGEVNCHRVYVAEAMAAKLVELTGEDWEVVHLPMDIEVIKQPETPELRPCEPTGCTQRGGG